MIIIISNDRSNNDNDINENHFNNEKNDNNDNGIININRFRIKTIK